MLSRREFFSLTASAVTLLPSLELSHQEKPLDIKTDDKVSDAGAVFKKFEETLMLKHLYDAVFPVTTDTVNIQELITEKDE